MEGLQLLTEKDLLYFKRMEEEGRAVIIELSIERLLMINPERWMKTETEMINEEEVLQWIRENGMIQTETERRAEQDEGNKLQKTSSKTLAEYLEGRELTKKQYEKIQWMIEAGFTKEQIIKVFTKSDIMV